MGQTTAATYFRPHRLCETAHLPCATAQVEPRSAAPGPGAVPVGAWDERRVEQLMMQDEDREKARCRVHGQL